MHKFLLVMLFLQLLLDQEQATLVVVEELKVKDYQQVVQAVQESLLLDNVKQHQIIKLLPESGQLMTHIITRKLDSGFQHQCHFLVQII